jgi:integrase
VRCPTIKRNETRLRFLDQPALEKLLATPFADDAFGRIEPTLYLVAAMTGLRQGELLGLRWRDVDFNASRLRVVSPYVRGEFADPKSVGSARSVPMADRVADAPRELHRATVFERPQDLVFGHPDTGNPLDRSRLVRRFAQAVKRAEVNTVTFHELRHTFGTRMAAAGVPIRTIQRWMGHADMKTTQVYAHYRVGSADGTGCSSLRRLRTGSSPTTERVRCKGAGRANSSAALHRGDRGEAREPWDNSRGGPAGQRQRPSRDP